MNFIFFFEIASCTCKTGFLVHTTSDENVFYMKVYLSKIFYPISTIYSHLDNFLNS
jgi:hypothetical protein